MIGRGEDQARLEAAAARLGVADHVIFGGFQSDTTAMLAAFDLYVAASVQETFGLSVLEAHGQRPARAVHDCPALDGIQTSQARQVAGPPEALRAEIRKAVEAGPRPRESDHGVFDRYGIESVGRAGRRPVRADPGRARAPAARPPPSIAGRSRGEARRRPRMPRLQRDWPR